MSNKNAIQIINVENSAIKNKYRILGARSMETRLSSLRIALSEGGINDTILNT